MHDFTQIGFVSWSESRGSLVFSRVPVGSDVIDISTRFAKEISKIFTINLIEILWKYLECTVQKFEKEKK